MQKNNIKFKHFVLFWIVTSYADGPFEKIAQLKKPLKHGILSPPGAKAVAETRRKRELQRNLEIVFREIKGTANLMQAFLAAIKTKNPSPELDEEQGGLPSKLPLVGLLAKGTYSAALKACVEKNEHSFKRLIKTAAWSQKVIFSKELKVKEVLRRLENKNIDEAIAKKYSVVSLSDMSDKIIDPSVETSINEIDPDIVEALYQYCKSAMRDMEKKYHTMLRVYAKELKMEAERERLNDIVLRTDDEENEDIKPTAEPAEELEPKTKIEEEISDASDKTEGEESGAPVEVKPKNEESDSEPQESLDEHENESENEPIQGKNIEPKITEEDDEAALKESDEAEAEDETKADVEKLNHVDENLVEPKAEENVEKTMLEAAEAEEEAERERLNDIVLRTDDEENEDIKPTAEPAEELEPKTKIEEEISDASDKTEGEAIESENTAIEERVDTELHTPVENRAKAEDQSLEVEMLEEMSPSEVIDSAESDPDITLNTEEEADLGPSSEEVEGGDNSKEESERPTQESEQ